MTELLIHIGEMDTRILAAAAGAHGVSSEDMAASMLAANLRVALLGMLNPDTSKADLGNQTLEQFEKELARRRGQTIG